ncbi:MAG TPA: FHA domain-containing protein [Gemmataceae bacterium]|nr:FHA domain-containing protein [Gemmataceae bacterium]
MSIRLQIIFGAGPPAEFEHPGPVVLIGLDPGCELSLQGRPADTVSRQHARIDVGADGATLSDAGSRNGTLLNGCLIEGPSPLRAGDSIQLGYTGPKLTVMRLSPAAPSRLRLRGRPAAWFVGAALVAVVVLVGLVAYWIHHRPGEANAIPPAPVAITTAVGPPQTSGNESHPQDTAKPPLQDAGKPLPPPPPPPLPLVGEVPEVGLYVAQPEPTPSVLLRREDNSWLRLRPGERVPAETTLMGLSGYRCDVDLDSGLTLTLWGNLLEFNAMPPLLLESVVVLNKPAEGRALDLGLDRGRIRLTRRKGGEPPRARVRFLRESFDVILHDPDSEVCAQLTYLPPRPAAKGQRDPSLPTLEVFTRGTVTLEARGREPTKLSGFARVGWDYQAKGPLAPITARERPLWWPESPKPTDDYVRDLMLSLKDWGDHLKGSGDLVDQIKGRLDREKEDVTYRQLGVEFLAAFDELPYLVNFLAAKEDKSARVRRGAAYALLSWVARRPAHLADLEKALRTQAGDREKAERILQLLLGFSPDELAQPETYQRLIAWLGDSHPAVAELASWHLELAFPDKVPDDTPFRAAAPPKDREPYIQEWQKRVPPGTTPAWVKNSSRNR